MKICEYLVHPEHDGMRLDSFLAQQPEVHSRSQAARLIENKAVKINLCDTSNKSERLVVGDRIYLELICSSSTTTEGCLSPNYEIPLDIRYEDDDLLVISKQSDLVCHPAPGHVSDTLANALVAHCGYDNLGLLQGEDRPGIVHRLDRDTTGLMLAAKSNDVQQALQDLIRLRILDRRYIVLVHGYIAHDEGNIVTGIARSRRDGIRMCVSTDPDAREAITSFKTLARYDAGRFDEGYTLLECHLYTGRTHQIRVHMRHIGHQVVGDPLYGKKNTHANRGLTRQFLHSWSLSFEHPTRHKKISVTDQLPNDLKSFLLGCQEHVLELTELGKILYPQIMGV